jgi:hypothetical protein
VVVNLTLRQFNNTLRLIPHKKVLVDILVVNIFHNEITFKTSFRQEIQDTEQGIDRDIIESRATNTPLIFCSGLTQF